MYSEYLCFNMKRRRGVIPLESKRIRLYIEVVFPTKSLVFLRAKWSKPEINYSSSPEQTRAQLLVWTGETTQLPARMLIVYWYLEHRRRLGCMPRAVHAGAGCFPPIQHYAARAVRWTLIPLKCASYRNQSVELSCGGSREDEWEIAG